MIRLGFEKDHSDSSVEGTVKGAETGGRETRSEIFLIVQIKR